MGEPRRGDQRAENGVHRDQAASEAAEDPWRWPVLFSVFFINLLNFGHFRSFGLYIRPLMEMFNATPSQVAWVNSIQHGLFSFLGPVASSLAQVTSPRTVALIGGCVACIGFAASSWANSITYLYFTFSLCGGIGVAFTFIPSLAMIARYFTKKRGFANGFCMSGNCIGGIVFPLLIEQLLEHFGFRGTVLIVGAILLHICVGAMFWRPFRERERSPVDAPIDVAGPSGIDGPRQRSESSCKDFPPIHEDASVEVACMGLAASRTSLVAREAHVRQDQMNPSFEADDSQTKVHVGDFPGQPDISEHDDVHICYPQKTYQSINNGYQTEPEKSHNGDGVCGSNGIPPKPAATTKRKIFDCSVMATKSFWIYTVTKMCMMIGYPGIRLFIPLWATHKGMSQRDIAIIFSVWAGTDFVGRLTISWLSDFCVRCRSLLFAGGAGLAGVSAIAYAYCNDLTSLAIVSGSFGFWVGASIGLSTSVIADIFGGDKVAMVSGMCSIFTGTAGLLGPPLLGLVMANPENILFGQQISTVVILCGAALFGIRSLICWYRQLGVATT